jgi:hypothetical protein
MKTKYVFRYSSWILISILSLGWALTFSLDVVLARDALLTTDVGSAFSEIILTESLSSDKADPSDLDPVYYFPVVMVNWPPMPPTPVLHDIHNPIWDRDYVVDWYEPLSPKTATVMSYTLQESFDSTFADVTSYQVLTPSVPFLIDQKPWGTMGYVHYRVKAHTLWGDGPWSDTESALLLSRSDDFNYPQTGWTARRTSAPDLAAMKSWYQYGRLVTGVEDRFDFGIFSPMQEAPEPPYRIAMRSDIIHIANETSYGIVFGGNKGEFCHVERANAQSADGCFSHYYRLNVIFGGYYKYLVTRVEGHSERGKGEGKDLMPNYAYFSTSDPTYWQTWEIRVYDNGFALYGNDEYLLWFPDTTYINDPYYGIFSSTYEYNGARFKHEYFRVEPLVGAEALPPQDIEPAVSEIDW